MSYRNRLFLPAFGGLLISFLIVCSLGEQYYAHGQANNSTAEEQEYRPWDWRSRVAEPISAPERNPNPDRDEWREEEDLKAQRDVAIWTYRAVVIGIISIALTALGVYLVWQTLRETRKATEAAVAAAEAIPKLERAHLFFRQRAVRWDAVASEITQCYYNSNVNVWFYFTNYGKTPAIIKSLSARICVSSDPPNTIVHDPNPPFAEEIIVQQQTTWHADTRKEIICEDDSAAIREGLKFLWLYGSIVYLDIFGDQHITRFQVKSDKFDKNMTPHGREYNERT